MPYKYNPLTKQLDYYEAGIGSITLNNMTDVDTSGATQDQILAYNSSSGTWSPATVSSSGATQLSELSDVDPSGATDNQVLVYDSGSGEWTPSDVVDSSTVYTATSYYVDGDSGDDDNDGSSWANAKKTLDFLYLDGYGAIPRELKADVTVNVRGTVLSRGTDYHTRITGFYGGGKLTIQGETSDEATGLTPTAYDNTSSSQTYHKYMTVAGASWGVNDYRGMFVQFTTPASDTLYPILSNTADTIQTTALPDLAGTETFKIVSLSSILKRATVADPSTPVEYGASNYDFFLIEKCIVSLEIKNIDFLTDNATALVTSALGNSAEGDANTFVSYSLTINQCRLSNWVHTIGSQCQITNSYIESEDNYGISDLQAIYDSVFYSIGGLSNGFFPPYDNYCSVKNVRFSNVRVALWLSNITNINNIEIDSSNEVGVIIYERGELYSSSTYFGPMVFTNNPIAIDIYKGGKLYVEDGLTHYFSGNTQDIRWNFRPNLYATWDQYYTGNKIEDNPLRSSGGTRYTPDEINNDMSFYVDGTSGNDNNDGSSWSEAKKTLDFLAEDATYPLPRIINSDVTVYCKNTIYSSGTTNFAKITGYRGTGSITIIGETTDAQTGLTPTGYDNTRTSLTYHQYIDVAAAGWVVDAYKGGFIVFTDGTSTEWFPILSNTATRLETVALPDLAGTETFKIVTLPTKFKAATTAAPGVPLTYDKFGLNGLLIRDNSLLVKIENIDFGSEFNGNYLNINSCCGTTHNLSATLSEKTTEITKCYSSMIWGITGPYVLRNSYLNATGYGGIVPNSQSHIYMSCIGSSDGNGNGLYFDQSTAKVTVERTRIEDCRFGLILGTSCSVRILYDIVIRGCNVSAISIPSNAVCRMRDNFYGAWIFENNTLGIDLAGGTLHYNISGDYLNYSGNTNDIKTSGNPDEFSDFSDLTAGNRISNLSERTFIIYESGGDWYTQPEYLNSTSGLTATTFQDAIDEVSGTTAADSVSANGFPNRTDSTYSFDDGLRRFSISPTGASYYYYVGGVKYTKTGTDTVDITNTLGMWFIYFDGSTLTATQTWSDSLILEKCLVNLLYWSTTDSEAIYIADERHGLSMSPETHEHLHESIGTVWYEGLGLTSITTDGDGSLDTHAQLGYGSGTIADEDLIFEIAADTIPAQIPMFYMTGSNNEWRRIAATNFPVINYSGGDNLLAYNEWTGVVWQLSEVGNNDYVLTHIIATNDPDQPIIGVVGQNEYPTIATARLGAVEELSYIRNENFPSAEYKTIATVIYQTKTTFTNTPKAITVSTDEGGDYIDWRTTNIAPSTGLTTDHGSLSGLADDDHTQYLLADGTRTASYIQFDITASAPTYSEGLLFYDNDAKTLGLYSKENDVILNLGQEQFVLATNKTGSQINNGQVVYIDSAIGSKPTVALADNTSDSSSRKIIGVATHDIPNNNDGFITTFGLVRELNTNSYDIGDELWLSSTPGAMSNVQDPSPAHAVKIGTVLFKDSSAGIILVSIQNSGDINNLHDVQINGVTDGEILKYNASNSRWENVQSSIIAEDTDVDAGGEIIDTFSASSWDACWWEYVLWNTNSGTSKRAGTVTVTWDESGGTVVYFDSSTNDIGDTTDAVLSAEYEPSGSQIQLIMTTTTDNWSIKVKRRTL